MYDIVTIGSATLDIFVQSNQFKLIKTDQVETGVALCEMYGAKIDVDDIVTSTGGGATNTAVSFARKGLHTGCIVEIGTDLPSKLILHDLQTEQIDISMIIHEPAEKTAVSVILSGPEGGRSIVTYRGASSLIGDNDIPWNTLFNQQQTKWLYVSSLGGNLQLLSKLVQEASNHKLKIAVNSGGAELKQQSQLLHLVPDIDVLILNQEETAQLFNIDYHREQELINQLRNRGGRISIMSQGDKGAYILTPNQTWFCPPTPVTAIQVTGAGDAFGSGFIAGQVLGWDIPKSAQLAIANAASVIQQIGAKKGLLTLSEFELKQAVEIIRMD